MRGLLVALRNAVLAVVAVALPTLLSIWLEQGGFAPIDAVRGRSELDLGVVGLRDDGYGRHAWGSIASGGFRAMHGVPIGYVGAPGPHALVYATPVVHAAVVPFAPAAATGTHALQLPTLDNLRCFLAAVEHDTFRRAAKAVALTPTAFSARIKQLEAQLGQPLFERTTRRVRLTRAGAALVPEAREALAQARRCVEVVHTDADPPAAFTLGTRFELGLSWVVPGLLEVERAHPTWRANVYFGSGPDIVDRLTAGDVDCIVTSAPLARASWTQRVLHEETYALVAAPELLAERPVRTRADLAEHVLFDVDRSLPLARYLLDAPGPAVTHGDVRTVGAGAAMLQYVRAGRGLAVLPEYMIAEDLAAGRLERLLPEQALLSDTFRLIWKADAPLSTVFEQLAEHLAARPLR